MTRRFLWPTVAAVAGFCGLAAATGFALDTEAQRLRASAAAEQANRERLALWRLDGAMLPTLSVENARPFAHYTPPSPLTAAELPPLARLHFQLDPFRGWSSPQPTHAAELATLREQFEVYPTLDELARHDPARASADAGAAAGLAVAKPPGADGDAKLTPSEAAERESDADGTTAGAGRSNLTYFTYNQDAGETPPTPAAGVAEPGHSGGPGAPPPHPFDSPPEYAARLRLLSQQGQYANTLQQLGPPPDAVADASSPRFGVRKPNPAARGQAVQVGPTFPVWLAPDVLLLARSVRLESRTVYQGVWLDWPRTRALLGRQVADLLPAAAFRPILTPADFAPDQAMTALPVRLDPGPVTPVPPAGISPLRVGLALAWLSAAVAFAVTLAGARSLSDLARRRMRFVSAVTHELRTPLTSLRLSLDLLSSGLITDPDAQADYLATLTAESERLNRLIDHVLEFSRLEDRGLTAELQVVPVERLLDELRETWTGRCRRDGKELVVVATVPAGQACRIDPRLAVGIVGNLLDNARKHSAGSPDNRVWLWAKPGEGGAVVFEVEDRGPGVPDAEQGTLFQPFRRGVGSDAVAGVGLGLALAARWAKLCGGSVSYRPADGGVGACFRLVAAGA